ncbi:sulfatase-like hydrolase/transferase [Mycobacteroides abscessus subsp. abscessus]|uniref:sulfatase-like hydrolase/transferase n=1 Tax=Mycobacteroides abscessus TaxID=36809 RepID=UPI0019D0C324|nr:sulfatase-like hydrolase/transferase [Mycobacteroides abscessus]MBN7438713.1 sulfatase-like hydrolase/transferase [Mycobacteroides abscessus subsp. abscessus]
MSILNRRTVLLGTAAAMGSAAVSPLLASCSSSRIVAPPTTDRSKPNVLVVLVDEMRFPVWFPLQERLDALLPNIARIRKNAVSFERHYTAANVCTAARSALVTGLYSHQTGCQLVSRSTLSPKFPTWGSMLRERGYQCYWYGKWHLGHISDTKPQALQAYGFDGGTFPSPDGAPGDGLAYDGRIADQFVNWFHDNADKAPWCTTVSLVNPHDIMFWPKWQSPQPIPKFLATLPGNFETPSQMRQRAKPRAQLNQIDAMQRSSGVMPYSGRDMATQWVQYLDLYLWLQQQVDAQIGKLLDALATRPEIDANTVVVFTADHGEYGGSHGMRAKGSGLYEENIRIPLYIRDPRRVLTPDPGNTRSQLTSSVDVAPLILTIATGDNQWRSDHRYQHLTSRADLAGICHTQGAQRTQGRLWIAHTTDEIDGNHTSNAPNHIVGVRTPTAKAGLYSHWKTGTTNIDTTAEQDHEFYDYTTVDGRLEITHQNQRNPKARELQDLLKNTVLPDEVNRALPNYLKTAQDEGMADLITATTYKSHLY